MSDLTPFDPVGLSRSDAGGLTYREAWRQYTRQALKRQEEMAGRTGGGGQTGTDAAGFARTPAKMTSGFDPTRATAREASDFFDKLCGGRKYEGPRWWVPGEVPGVEFYQG